ncbi:hypothetical protein RirG_249950 [Rhizophagus irregularis DAOM 197198w]|uniref:Reverse transcriptase zinc-binding domain-containing protein n=2 Tax=Rhizophagus irregularis TaxID=588596 RepID=A0A015I6V6_RHIIW|nr:hypothetical protein RirG_249950 [Rhizophagus irregularis DAOM 197198w]
MGFGWVNKDDSSTNLNISFFGGTSLSPSSSKAEAYAILTLLLVVPPNFKAHSGDFYNDLADKEAGKGLNVPPITINPKFIPDVAMIPMWDCIGPIDRDIRKFCQNITDAVTFDSFTSNNNLQLLFKNHSTQAISWSYTKLWQHQNDTLDVCSSDKSKKHSFKMKSLNHILPCGDVLSAHYPSLYSQNLLPIKCPLCGRADDTNQHLGFCPDLIQLLTNVLLDAKALISKRVTTELNTFYTNSTLTRDLDASPLFSPVVDATHLVYLIIHNVVPQSLVDLIHSHTRKTSHSTSIVMDVMKLIHLQFLLMFGNITRNP